MPLALLLFCIGRSPFIDRPIVLLRLLAESLLLLRLAWLSAVAAFLLILALLRLGRRRTLAAARLLLALLGGLLAVAPLRRFLRLPALGGRSSLAALRLLRACLRFRLRRPVFHPIGGPLLARAGVLGIL